jgi:hypothetical protein
MNISAKTKMFEKTKIALKTGKFSLIFAFRENDKRGFRFNPNSHPMNVESTGGMFIPPGITSLWTKNPLEEWDSAGNYQLIYADSHLKDHNTRKIPLTVKNPGSASSNPLYCQCQFKKKHESLI